MARERRHEKRSDDRSRDVGRMAKTAPPFVHGRRDRDSVTLYELHHPTVAVVGARVRANM
jgi:hypothetical protein